MPKRRVADVVDECKRFNKFRVQPERSGNRTCNLGDFERVGEPVPEVIREARGEDLCLGFKPPEGAGMNDAVAVAGVFAAVGRTSG